MKKILIALMAVMMVGCSTAQKPTKVVMDDRGVIKIASPVEFTAVKASVPEQAPAPEYTFVTPETPVVVEKEVVRPDILKLVDAEEKALEKEMYDPLPKWAVVCVAIAGIFIVPLMILVCLLALKVRANYRRMKNFYEN